MSVTKNRYEVNCDECINQNTDICSDCSIARQEDGCSCHNNPPCSFCTNLLFEEK